MGLGIFRLVPSSIQCHTSRLIGLNILNTIILSMGTGFGGNGTGRLQVRDATITPSNSRAHYHLGRTFQLTGTNEHLG